MKTWTILELLQETRRYFERCGITTARLDAELLLAHCLSTDRIRLYIDFENQVTPDELSRFRELVRRRGQREPVAHIVGYKEFWSLKLQVTGDVLIPRPETETLVEAAVRIVHDSEKNHARCRILDVGTGSGAIALALAQELDQADIFAVDLSAQALRVALTNISAHDAGRKIHLIRGDGLAPFAWKENFDMIVSNPPYIRTGDIERLEPDIRCFEPLQALDGGTDGLDFYKTWIPHMSHLLHRHGWMVFELGDGQAQAVSLICRDAGMDAQVSIIKDYARQDRIIMAQKS
jgi:release factor glutamine methyltransferase